MSDTATFKVIRRNKKSTTNSPIRSSSPSNGFTAAYKDMGTTYDSDHKQDPDWIAASKVVYAMQEGKPEVELSDEDYADFGLETMGWFNSNLPGMTLDAASMSGATDDQKRAFLYLMDGYDTLGYQWSGTGRFLKGAAQDVTNYFGLAGFGLGFLFKAGAKKATKEGVKSLLRRSIQGGVVAGIEGAAYSATTDINRQVVETAVSGEEIDKGRVAKQAVIGGAITAVTGGALTGATGKIADVRGAKKLKKEAAENADKLKKAADEAAIDIDAVVQEPIIPNSPAGRVKTSLASVKKVVQETVKKGLPAVDEAGVQNLSELRQLVKPIQDELAKAAKDYPDEIADYFIDTKLSVGQASALKQASLQSTSQLKLLQSTLISSERQLEGVKAQQVRDVLDELDEIIAPLDELDVALSGVTGQDLGARRGQINTGNVRGLNVKKVMEDEGLSKAQARRLVEQRVAAKVNEFKQSDEIAQLNKKINEARKDDSRLHEFVELKAKLAEKEAEFRYAELGESRVVNGGTIGINAVNEVAIGSVFSPKTVIINVIPSAAKTIYKPLINSVMQQGFNKAAYRQMTAEYSSMVSIAPTAFKAAISAFRYERSMLIGDTARFLENYNTIPKAINIKGKTVPTAGGLVRLWPRLLLASDSFFEQVHYRGFMTGQATSDAMEDAAQRVASGELAKADVDAFVKDAVSKAVEKAYKPEIKAKDILLEEGIDRGLRGKKLENFIKRELANPQGLANKLGLKPESVFKKARNVAGKDYVNDILYKRDFSGEGTASSAAKMYEKMVNKHPMMRLFGQLFFRTPVRVFEEGFRLTPGVQMLAPKFIDDLKGKNGKVREIRAQGEALMAYGIMATVFQKYAEGKLTGSLGDDYKQRRQGENTRKIEAYTYTFDDGSSFNYRNFDPFSTPVKIIVNALEKTRELEYRQQQGEDIPQSVYEEVYQSAALGFSSIVQAVRDANLASGIDEIIDLTEDLSDYSASDQIVKYLGQKAQMFLPNTLYKIEQLDNPALSDPATIEQFIGQRLNPKSPLVPKQHTALGRERELTNPASGLNPFDRTTQEERLRKPKGITAEQWKKELEVEEYLYVLGQAGDTHFTAPHIYRDFNPDLDLRTQNVTKKIDPSKGLPEESLYSRWMRYTYQDKKLVDSILKIKQYAPPGKPAITEVKNSLNAARQQAFVKMMKEEGMDEEWILNKLKRARDNAGQNFVPNVPFNIGTN